MAVNLATADTYLGLPVLPFERNFTGTTLGAYRLGERLGAGGMGAVYRADGPDGSVAVKILFPALASEPDLLERFAQEAGALRRLDHANIVRFSEQGEAGGLHYLVMEHLPGRDLEQTLGEGPLAVDVALLIARQVADALQAAHAAGIVHRDLKPSNIILAQPPPTPLVKVVDFGIAHVTHSDLTLTRSNALLGSVNYMAPEQRTDAKNVDHRADQFALGVILYRMLTGALPMGAFEAPSTLRPGLPRGLDTLIERALQRDPARRFASALALGEALVALERRRGVASKGRRLAAAALAATLLVGVAGWWALGEPGPGEGSPAAADPSALDQAGEPLLSQADVAALPSKEGMPQQLAIEPPGSGEPAQRADQESSLPPAQQRAVTKEGAASSPPVASPPSAVAQSVKERPSRSLYYRVTDVDADDRLRIRRAPDADAEEIGSLPAEARCLRVLRKRSRNGETWWRAVQLPPPTGKRRAASPAASTATVAAGRPFASLRPGDLHDVVTALARATARALPTPLGAWLLAGMPEPKSQPGQPDPPSHGWVNERYLEAELPGACKAPGIVAASGKKSRKKGSGNSAAVAK